MATSNLMILYYLINLVQGSVFTSFGPIIPFLAYYTGKSEGQFSYLMMTRGIFFMVACLIKVTVLKNQTNLNQTMWASNLLTGSGTILFTLSFNPYILTASMMINSIGFCLSDIYISICMMTEGKENPKHFLAIGYGMQSLGSIIGPILVSLFQFKGIFCSGILLVIFGLIVGRIPSPKEQEHVEVEQNEKNQAPKKTLTLKSLIYLCINMILYAVQELSIRTWFPSFCLMIHYLQRKQDAALTVSFYLIIQIITRFFLKMDVIRCLNQGIFGVLVTTIVVIIAYFFQLGYFIIAAAIVGFGYFVGLHYPYLIAAPKQFGIQVRLQDTTYLLISYAFGEGILTAFSGYLMDLIHPMSLFYYLLIVGLLRQVLHWEMLKAFEEQTGTSTEKQNLEMKLLNHGK